MKDIGVNARKSAGKERKMMKRRICLFLAACLLCTASMALAAGNVTIAVRGQDGFDSYISSMFVWGDRLLMSSYDGLYAWSQEGGLVEVEGYQELDAMLTGTPEEPGIVELEEDQYCYLDAQIFVVDNRLYRLAQISGEDGSEQSLFVEIVIGEDGALSLGEVVDMGDSLLIDYGDGYTGYRSFSNPCSYENTLYAISWGENAQEIVAIDMEAGTLDALYLDTDRDILGLSPFTEGKLLVIAADYTTDPVATFLMTYDLESEELTDLGTLPMKDYQTPNGLCYDEARGKMYYVLAGSVWRMDVTEEGLGEPEEFGDMPLEIYSDSSAVLMGDLYILSSYEGVVGRDVTLDKLPEQRLRVENTSYIEPIRQAYYAFTDAHPEYMVSISNGGSTGDFVQDMMNRSAEVDIYTISSEDNAFSALMERGFMAELGGSEKLTNYVSTLYPVIRSLVTREEELYAVPLESYASGGLAINTKLLTEKFGYTQEEIPTTWPQMFELLADLSSGRMQDVPEATLLSPGYIQRDAKQQIFSMMLQDYFLWLDQSEENLMRGSEVLMACCEAFEKIDWTGFGMPEEYEDDMMWEYQEENILIESYSVDINYYFSQNCEPVAQAIAEGEEPLMGLNVTMAFVNPFSEHREAAIEYLEAALDCMQLTSRMNMDPTLNDPVENEYYEENMKSIEQSIADIQTAMEETEDEEQREMLSQNLTDMQTWKEEYEKTGRYDVSEEDIARYRAFGDAFVVQKATVWSTGAYEQVTQYLDGAMNAQQLASELEKTLQMQRLEGI